MRTVPHRFDPDEVAATVVHLFHDLFPGESSRVVRRLFAAVRAMFAGQYLNYEPIDLGYHDLTHTLQATLCYTYLFEGWCHAGAMPLLSTRDFEVGLAAVLLHDSGYLRLQADQEGTGAKYTHVHVLRSGAFAASFVPKLGFNATEAQAIASAIFCTGPNHGLNEQYFRRPETKTLAAMLVTADFLGQMAAPDYPYKLDILYGEFKESDDFFLHPPEKRSFTSADDLKAKTPAFWHEVVRPMLDRDLLGLYQYLADPFPAGPNAYLDAIEYNVHLVELGFPLHAGT